MVQIKIGRFEKRLAVVTEKRRQITAEYLSFGKEIVRRTAELKARFQDISDEFAALTAAAKAK